MTLMFVLRDLGREKNKQLLPSRSRLIKGVKGLWNTASTVQRLDDYLPG